MEATKTTMWSELRKPFPKGTVGKVNKGFGEIDYVGHAAVTDRLLEFDPFWTWEPLATDEQGLPALDKEGNLWIKLTIKDVTRLGVGDGKNMKERIGDAIRNAAMRFGVALDLWSKDELESNLEHPENKNIKAGVSVSGSVPNNPVHGNRQVGVSNVGSNPTTTEQQPAHKITEKQIEAMFKIAKTKGAKDKTEATRILNTLAGVEDFAQINTKEGSALMQKLLDTPKDAIEMISGEVV